MYPINHLVSDLLTDSTRLHATIGNTASNGAVAINGPTAR